MSECGRVISVIGERVSGHDGEGGGAGAGGGEWPYLNRQCVARRRSRCPRTDGRAAMGGGDEGPCRYHAAEGVGERPCRYGQGAARCRGGCPCERGLGGAVGGRERSYRYRHGSE